MTLKASSVEEEPALGGPDRATVGQRLYKYAHRRTVVKGDAKAEFTRINNYLLGAKLPALRLVVDKYGHRVLEQVVAQPKAKNQQGWQDYIDVGRELRAGTYAFIDKSGGMK